MYNENKKKEHTLSIQDPCKWNLGHTNTFSFSNPLNSWSRIMINLVLHSNRTYLRVDDLLCSIVLTVDIDESEG